MKRIFLADPAVDLLLNAYISKTDVKLARIINQSIYNYFLPISGTLSIEANYILQQELDKQTDLWENKQSLSRGIKWLTQYHISDPTILKRIYSHFPNRRFDPAEDTKAPPAAKGIFDIVIDIIKKNNPSYNALWTCYLCLFEDILDHWDVLWDYNETYDALSTLVYIYDPIRPFSWYDVICLLKDIEYFANMQHGIKPF